MCLLPRPTNVAGCPGGLCSKVELGKSQWARAQHQLSGRAGVQVDDLRAVAADVDVLYQVRARAFQCLPASVFHLPA